MGYSLWGEDKCRWVTLHIQSNMKILIDSQFFGLSKNYFSFQKMHFHQKPLLAFIESKHKHLFVNHVTQA